jgi:phospholipid/cholesterol/gamma-HCH transport system substrate-binding protein
VRAVGALALAAALVAVALFARAGSGDREVVAEFASARGLVEGNDVRVLGAPAGSIERVALSPHGTALVTMRLDDAVPAPRADAAASIQPVDLLGDNYLALDPGRAEAPLRGTIPAARTANAPRLDELLATFRPGVREALGLLLVESGLALDRRGADLGRATVALRPALEAATGVARDLQRENAALAALVSDAERAAGQLARRAGDLGPLVGGLHATLRAVAAQRAPLDSGLRGAPAVLGQLERTAGRLEGTAGAAIPIAEDLRTAAGPLGGALTGLPALARSLRGAAGDLRPAVTGLRTVLRRGGPAFAALADALPALGAVAPQATVLLDHLRRAAPGISEGFFVNFADQAAEPGRQPFDPFADPRRAYWRGAAVFSCEAFGVPVEPGCLQKVLAAQDAKASPATRRLLDYLLGA